MNTIISTHFVSTGLVRTMIFTGAAGLAFAACGGDDPAPLSEPAVTASGAPASSPPTTTAAPPAAAVDAAVKISQTPLGDVLADPDGMTLYAFTNDAEASSTCYGTCAEAWPPVLVDPAFIVSPGLDSGIFATTERDDGTFQLVAGKWPLYRFAADAKPGDITGQGSGDVWFAVDTGGRTISGDAAAPADEGTAGAATTPAPDSTTDPYGDSASATTIPTEAGADVDEAAVVVQLADTELGAVLTDADGMTLYLFTPDEAGSPTCTGGCAGAWPPLLVDDGAELTAGEGIDASTLSTVEHPDGGQQLKIGKWPLYRFAGDAAPGDTTGQGSGGSWFVVGADGKAIK